MAKVCCVCNDSKETLQNSLYHCRGHGCDVTVHQGNDVDLEYECPLKVLSFFFVG